ncbi:hypothetical protein [Wenzhouxiangella sediminis]|uniref:Uncharacterized protein n=1 Tax=Wenzhouxiangella sediminis TaxID=1792836 RepID=A0A3E1K972_9GAMM|nr:hypothetical protein [Wenzhouxiangella sediminis]RFF30673.1 hypothetical protein DZC52_07000 [Wenzhouxiangella sediminis]
MNRIVEQARGKRVSHYLRFSLAWTLVLLSAALGLIAAAIATWQAQLAGSILYMPLGLVIALALIPVAHKHKPIDLLLLALMLLGVAFWFSAESPQQAAWRADLSNWITLLGSTRAALLLMVLLLLWLWSSGRVSLGKSRPIASPADSD